LRFWPPKKKTTKRPLSFATVVVFGPQDQFLIKKIIIITRDTTLRVPHQRRPSQNWSWGPKLLQLQNLGDGFVVFFFFGGQNRNFGKVRGLKLLLNLKYIT